MQSPHPSPDPQDLGGEGVCFTGPMPHDWAPGHSVPTWGRAGGAWPKERCWKKGSVFPTAPRRGDIHRVTHAHPCVSTSSHLGGGGRGGPPVPGLRASRCGGHGHRWLEDEDEKPVIKTALATDRTSDYSNYLYDTPVSERKNAIFLILRGLHLYTFSLLPHPLLLP